MVGPGRPHIAEERTDAILADVLRLVFIALLGATAWFTRPASPLWPAMAAQATLAQHCEILVDIKPYEPGLVLPAVCAPQAGPYAGQTPQSAANALGFGD
jgi:hypothetical protein